MTPYEYTVLLHPAAEGGFWAEVPALPGCLAQGETVEETLANVQEAAEAHLQALRNEGRTVPEEEGVLVARVRVGREASAPATAGRQGTGSR
jgi:predicted RNase H-like HicB family nuclease